MKTVNIGKKVGTGGNVGTNAADRADPHLDAYREALTQAFLKAVFDQSIDGRTRVMHVHTGEVLQAALSVAALFCASDPQFVTPAGRKAGAREVARRFMDRVRGAQAAGGVVEAMRGRCPVVILNDDDRLQ
jgi:hypothetical protein